MDAVLEAAIAGNRKEMVEVAIDPLRLEAYNVTAGELISVVQNKDGEPFVYDSEESAQKKAESIKGKVVKGTAKAIGSGSSAFGTSSFSKESKITFKDYLNKL